MAAIVEQVTIVITRALVRGPGIGEKAVSPVAVGLRIEQVLPVTLRLAARYIALGRETPFVRVGPAIATVVLHVASNAVALETRGLVAGSLPLHLDALGTRVAFIDIVLAITAAYRGVRPGAWIGSKPAAAHDPLGKGAIVFCLAILVRGAIGVGLAQDAGFAISQAPRVAEGTTGIGITAPALVARGTFRRRVASASRLRAGGKSLIW
jgi:hypothetical protein